MLDVTNAVVPSAMKPAHDRGVVVVDLNLQSESGDAHNDEVDGDNAVAAAKVVPPPAKHHVALEVLDLHPEHAPLVG